MSSNSPVLFVHRIPIATTIIAAARAGSLYRRSVQRPTSRVSWRATGIACAVGEFIGLILIWLGERTCAWRPAVHAAPLAERQVIAG